MEYLIRIALLLLLAVFITRFMFHRSPHLYYRVMVTLFKIARGREWSPPSFELLKELSFKKAWKFFYVPNAAIDRFLEENGRTPENLLGAAGMARQSLSQKKGLALLEECLDLEPQDPVYYARWISSTIRKSGFKWRDKLLKERTQRFQELDPENALPCYLLCEIAIHKHDYEGAVALGRQAAGKDRIRTCNTRAARACVRAFEKIGCSPGVAEVCGGYQQSYDFLWLPRRFTRDYVLMVRQHLERDLSHEEIEEHFKLPLRLADQFEGVEKMIRGAENVTSAFTAYLFFMRTTSVRLPCCRPYPRTRGCRAWSVWPDGRDGLGGGCISFCTLLLFVLAEELLSRYRVSVGQVFVVEDEYITSIVVRDTFLGFKLSIFFGLYCPHGSCLDVLSCADFAVGFREALFVDGVRLTGIIYDPVTGLSCLIITPLLVVESKAFKVQLYGRDGLGFLFHVASVVVIHWFGFSIEMALVADVFHLLFTFFNIIFSVFVFGCDAPRYVVRMPACAAMRSPDPIPLCTSQLFDFVQLATRVFRRLAFIGGPMRVVLPVRVYDLSVLLFQLI